MHLSLPRKWRPQSFEALVGQEAVARTLEHAIADGKINHAYLFTGPRGVGKTTTARILASCLNCENGPTVTPCGACASCREIRRGEAFDTLELDAASNNKVEDARELIETLRYAPQRDRYRILILDEVHMLSKPAFNALLKTIEEPPPYAVFILASTELHKIPATIISRCQRFSFGALSETQIRERLAEVAREEKIVATPEAFGQIARAAEGSMRDALKLLEQAATMAGGAIDESKCAEMFALVDRATLQALFSAAITGDRAGTMAVLSQSRREGLDPRHGAQEFLSFLRDLVMAAAGAPTNDADRSLASAASYETLLRALALAVETGRQMNRSSDPWLVWELSLLKMAELPRLRSLEAALARPASTPARETDSPRFISLVPARGAETGPAAPSPNFSKARQFRTAVESKRAIAGTYVSLATSIEEEDGSVVLQFPIDRAAAKEALEKPEMTKLLAEAAALVWGRPMSVRLVAGPPANGDLAAAAREIGGEILSRERASNRAHEDPMVRKAMALFRGEVVDVKEEK